MAGARLLFLAAGAAFVEPDGADVAFAVGAVAGAAAGAGLDGAGAAAEPLDGLLGAVVLGAGFAVAGRVDLKGLWPTTLPAGK